MNLLQSENSIQVNQLIFTCQCNTSNCLIQVYLLLYLLPACAANKTVTFVNNQKTKKCVKNRAPAGARTPDTRPQRVIIFSLHFYSTLNRVKSCRFCRFLQLPIFTNNDQKKISVETRESFCRINKDSLIGYCCFPFTVRQEAINITRIEVH